jgi:VanZ family protein
MLLVRSFANAEWSRVGRRSVMSAVVTGIFYAASDEFHQYFTPGREADLIDLFMDSVGVSAGAAAVWTWGIIRAVRAG